MTLSNEIKEAANHILSHAQGLEATLVLARAVESVNLIEQAAIEATARADAATADKAKAEDDLDEISIRIVKANDELAGLKAANDKRVSDARLEAAAIIADAKRKAESEAAAIVAKGNAELADIRGKIKSAESDLAGVEAEIEKAKATLAETEASTLAVNARAEEARAYLKSIVAAS